VYFFASKLHFLTVKWEYTTVSEKKFIVLLVPLLVGLRTAPEMYILAVWFGFCLAPAQAYGRALFSELIPEGHEADMFALFAITDKVGRRTRVDPP
jgi:MFS-type transporter involved in bile tolerance (Atg22 family)